MFGTVTSIVVVIGLAGRGPMAYRPAGAIRSLR
jgi:hypothetical protein